MGRLAAVLLLLPLLRPGILRGAQELYTGRRDRPWVHVPRGSVLKADPLPGQRWVMPWRAVKPKDCYAFLGHSLNSPKFHQSNWNKNTVAASSPFQKRVRLAHMWQHSHVRGDTWHTEPIITQVFSKSEWMIDPVIFGSCFQGERERERYRLIIELSTRTPPPQPTCELTHDEIYLNE